MYFGVVTFFFSIAPLFCSALCVISELCYLCHNPLRCADNVDGNDALLPIHTST